jgi:hypothetical protein
LNQFQKDIINSFPSIIMDDFLYFTKKSEEKIKKMGLPEPQCKLNSFFYSSDAIDMKYHQREYCLLNCGLKCKADQRFADQ